MIEADGLDDLIADLAKAPLLAGVRATKAVETSSRKIQQTAQRLASGIAHAPHYPRSISYDVAVTPAAIEGEIGPDKSRTQGALGNLLEYGSRNNAPLAHMGPALDLEGPNFENGIAEAAEKSLW